MSSAETKKPPVAPKPRLVIGHKTVPPPVAPKPEVVVVDVLQSSRKTKPVIAPKPKVLKCSTVPEVKTVPTSIRRNLKTLEDHKKDSSEYLVHLNYKNGIPTDNAAYIISLCSCSFECIHKCGNREDTRKNATIFEQLENLENIDIDEQPSSLKRGTIFESNNENNLNNHKIVLKANDIEEKLEDVMIQNVFPNNGHLRQKLLSELETVNTINSNKNVKIEFTDFSPPIFNIEELKDRSDNDAKLAAVESEMLEVPLLTENNNCFSLSNPAHMEKMDVDNTSMIPCKKDSDNLSFGTNSVISTKPFPIPKPRKLHTPCLVRQDGVDVSGEDECDSSGIHEFAVKNTTKINVLVQSVSYKNQEHKGAVDKSEVPSYSVRKVHPTSESTDSKELIPPSQSSEIVHEHCQFLQNIGHSSDLNSINPSINIMEDNSMLATDAKETGFVRCSNLSMSLPKQIKLSCNQSLSALVTLDNSAQKKEAKDAYLKGESSSQIIPQKPQRHGIAVAGLLKKSASEELLDTSAYFSSENKTLEAPLGRARIRHFSGREENAVLLSDTLTPPLEKPVWKLPHPILPFSGNPETLKNTKNAKKVENLSTVTKPRAKSLSSVDMDRIHKPPKEPQKKSSLKKFLNMKWSAWMLKSDFQKFLAKGTQSTDNANGNILSREGPGKNGNATTVANGRKTKPAKAHSAEIGSFFSQKGKQKIKGQNEIEINQRSKSLDEQTFSLQGHLSSLTQDNIHEYENVSHYEEIPEYENLPFAAIDKKICFDRQNSSGAENQDANMYEVEELYEPTGNCLEFGRSSAERDGSELMLEDIHSDDEIMPRDMNSSDDDDDDDTNSDSSKGESDAQENKQFRAAGKKTKVYHIAKEIMSSEKVFVDVLKLLHIDFRDSVAHASRQFGKLVIEDKILNQILYYLPQLYELNRDLLRELEERLSHWIDHQRIADIFVKKGPYLKMYSTYIKEFDRNITLLDEHCKKNPGFAAVVREFEMSPRCANLALKHYLLKPVQRIPQYRLLLTDYLKNLLEDSADFKDTQDALAVVIEVANHANDIMKQGDNFQKLMQIQYRLTGHHEIVQPGRVFLKEGTLMKLSRKVMQPRMFFLFNDTLLYTTPLQSGMYKLNNMLSLAGMKVKKPTHEAYQNELNIESVERSFILSANSATERDEWLETISRSIEEYTKKRITFNPTKSLEETDQEEEEERPIGSKAPIWIPDTRATMCMICTSEFTLTWRRHHCRACGKIICQACSSNKHGLDYMKNHPARVCDHCFKELQKQDNMYTSKNGSPLNHRLPTNALSTVLHSIPSGRKQKKIPAALKEVSANTEDSSISGYLYRSKGTKKPWKHLWFVIKNKVLYTYAASEDVAALESQPLLGFTVAEVKDEHLESKVFHLLHKNTLFYIFKSDDSQSAQKWIEAFQEATIL